MSTTRGWLLDTNVISELVRESPDGGVVRWLGRQSASALYLSVITLGELMYGVARLPAGVRRERLTSWLHVDIHEQFAGRVLSFGEPQAFAWGELRAKTERRGAARNTVDLQLAATAAVAELALVTRNTRDFDGLGLALVDPWARR